LLHQHHHLHQPLGNMPHQTNPCTSPVLPLQLTPHPPHLCPPRSGYPSLSALIRANSDYVVDGVCRQLRALEHHPRAPHMLAALLRKARCGPELLPLLAEPARAALQGLSILARRKQPQYTSSFLQVRCCVVLLCGAAG
jgi:hypothetical protein